MCLSTVLLDSDSGQEKVMQDVAYIEAKDDGLLLIGLMGEQKFIQGKLKSIDLIDRHEVILESP